MRARVSLALPMTEHRSFPTGAKMLNPKEGKNKRKQRWHSLCNPCLTFTRETAPICLPCLPSHCHLTRGRSTFVGPPPLGVSRPAAARDGRKHRLLPDTQPAFLGRVGRCGAAGLRRGSDAAHSSTSVPCKPKSSPPPHHRQRCSTSFPLFSELFRPMLATKPKSATSAFACRDANSRLLISLPLPRNTPSHTQLDRPGTPEQHPRNPAAPKQTVSIPRAEHELQHRLRP